MDFDHFITPTYIKGIFIIGLLVLVAGMLSVMFGGLSIMKYSAATGVTMVFGSIIGAGIGLLFWRVICELLIVRFRIYDELHAIRTGGDIGTTGAVARPSVSQAPKPSWRTE